MLIYKKLYIFLFALSLNFFSFSMETKEIKALPVQKLQLLALNCTILHMKSFDTSCCASTQQFLEYIKPLSLSHQISSQVSSCMFPKADYLWKLLPYRLISEEKLQYPAEPFPGNPYVGLRKCNSESTVFHPLKNYVAAVYNCNDTDSNAPLLRVALWNLSSKKIIDLDGYRNRKKFYKYHRLIFSKGARYLTALYGIAKNSSWNNNNPSRDWGVHIWDLETLEHDDQEVNNLFEISNGNDPIWNLKLSDNENYLIINHDVWHLPMRRNVEHHQEEKFEGIAFHPSKNYLAGKYYTSDDSEKSLALWNLESNEIINLKGSLNPDLLAFSKDCRYLVEVYYTCKKCPSDYSLSINSRSWGIRIWNLETLGQENQNFNNLLDISTGNDPAYVFKLSDNGDYFKTNGDIWHIPTQQKVSKQQKGKIKKEFFSNNGSKKKLPFSLTVENIALYTNLFDNIIKKNELSKVRYLSNLLDATSRSLDEDIFQFIDECRVLKTYRSDKRTLEILLKDASLATTVKLMHLSNCRKDKCCLSCKHLKLPQKINQFLMNNSAITKCNSCCKKE